MKTRQATRSAQEFAALIASATVVASGVLAISYLLIDSMVR